MGNSITVYHGTAEHLVPLILAQGFRPLREGAAYPLYVSTKPEVADIYATGWIGASIYCFETNGHLYSEEGAVLALTIDRDQLEIDDYDLIHEPDQYRLRVAPPASAIHGVHYVTECTESLLERIEYVTPERFSEMAAHWVEA